LEHAWCTETADRQNLLSTEDRDALTAAYLFLRDVEHKLQMVDDLQTHSLPESAEELARCAVRMGYGTEDRTASCKRFASDHVHHTKMVHDQFISFFSRPESSPILHGALQLSR